MQTYLNTFFSFLRLGNLKSQLFVIFDNVILHFFQGVPEQKLRGHLGSFGITGNLALQPMYTLSGKNLSAS